MGRDLEVVRQDLEPWLAAQLGGATDVTLSELRAPGSGAANDTYLGDVEWAEPDGERHRRSVVFRVQPVENQFLDPDVMFQARVLDALAPHLPVPEVLWREAGSEPLGAAFYVMGMVEGSILTEVPSYHEAGWAAELSVEEQARFSENALQALATFHRIEVTSQFEFLRRPGSGTALDRHFEWLQRWYDWAARGRSFDILEAGLAYVLSHRPDDPSEHLVWGDARPGNMIFTDDLSVAAVIDWELAATGPAEIDLGWWLMFEEFLTTGSGATRLPGVPDRAATIARYEELLGRATRDVEYYEILAALQFGIIILRFVDLRVEKGVLPADTKMRTETPLTQILARAIGADAPDVSPDYPG
jgi:aminoglycoside phosphotransferase (APT) family kinase protein